MKPEWQLKLQAYVDDELSSRERRQVEGLLATDPDAQPLADELRGLRACLKGSELAPTVPDSRSFYWSKIERRIAAPDRVGASESSSLSLKTLARWLVPAAGLATLVLGLIVLENGGLRPRYVTYVSQIEDYTGPETENSSITFRSQAESMTVVWVQNRWDLD